MQNIEKRGNVISYLSKGEAIGTKVVMEEREGRDEVP